ncbi:ATP-binding cassette domain-containing protein [Gilvimarinus agarilyticus]|uniref:ATP-binding cassette domain-containing protein n=1 Tax=Gilvimarinus agarilyticus TaxID=679259 RepID=UPI00059FD2B5|nr:ATP-binding cassette domain-containing protein [Gilvimarinus agarilyticus]
MLELQHVAIVRAGQTLLEVPELSVAAGKVGMIMGPSGSGKSTLLLWLLGQAPEAFDITGSLRLNGEPMTHQSVSERRIGMMFQSALLFPHMTVEQNLFFALPKQSAYRTKAARTERVGSLLAAVELSDKAKTMPGTLSGGERARIALLRALINEPKALLLDEPFAALDLHRREEVRQWTFAQIAQWQIPALLVSHDLDDRPAHTQQCGPLLTIANGVAQCSTHA